MVEEQEFAESKSETASNKTANQTNNSNNNTDFMNVPDIDSEELPFN